VEQALAAAAVDGHGNIVYRQVSTTTGQAVVVPVDRDGSILTFWTPEEAYPEGFIEDSFRDEEANVLTTMVSTPGGYLAEPVDAHLRPTIGTLRSIVASEGEMNVDPQRGFLESLPPSSSSQESLSRESQGEQSNAPSWLTQQLSRGARDTFGNLLTKRMRAADGGWADVLIDQEDRPLQFWVDMDNVSQPPNEGANRELMTFIVAQGGQVAVPFDPEVQRPAYSPNGVEQRMSEQPPSGTDRSSSSPS
jgi:hypothetical protein